MQRSGWTEAAVRAVIAQQARRERRRALADAVIHNEALTPSSWPQQVPQLWVACGRELKGRPRKAFRVAVEQSSHALQRRSGRSLNESLALVLYEYPFNEGIRTMLRLEHLFDRLAQLMPRDRRWTTTSRWPRSSRSWTSPRAPTSSRTC
jgi:hypothetical protein